MPTLNFIPVNVPYARADYKIMEKLQRDGLYILAGEYRLSDDAEWETADSIHDIDDPKDSCYLSEIKYATIKQYLDCKAAAFG